MLLLRTTADSAASYIRTDQLDGETDWKLRKAVHFTQQLSSDNDLFHMKNAKVYAEKPKKDIYDFIGNFIYSNHHHHSVSPPSLPSPSSPPSYYFSFIFYSEIYCYILD